MGDVMLLAAKHGMQNVVQKGSREQAQLMLEQLDRAYSA